MKGDGLAIGLLVVAAAPLVLEIASAWVASGRVRDGDALLARNEHRGALAKYEGAIALDACMASAHMGRARALCALWRRGATLASARRATRLEPGSADAHELVADVLFGLGRQSEAADSLRTAVRLDPSRLGTHKYLCALLQECGRYGEAVAAHERALELSPEDSMLWYYHGVALEFLARERPGESSALRRRAMESIARARGLDRHNPYCEAALDHIRDKLCAIQHSGEQPRGA